MSRLDQIKWNDISRQLLKDIGECPESTQRDLYKIWDNLGVLVKELSQLEVVERRTMGSSGLKANEKLDELNKRIQHLKKMMTIAHLSS